MTENTFAQLQLIEPLQKAIQETGYTTPTPIQLESIPHLLKGSDILGCAQTGTGKTAAFALPILQNLFLKNRRLEPKQARALILTPTRELAVQIEESFRTYGKHLRIKTALIFGGVSQGPQVRAMAGGVDVLVATPGRLMDLIQQRFVSLSQLEIFVLDEADRMLDMGFVHEIKKIIAMLPQRRQSLFFSATMPPDIQKLASTMLTNPVRVEVTPTSSTVDVIEQSVMYVDKAQKRNLLRHILQDKQLRRVIVFTRTKQGANRVVEVLDKSGLSSAAIHGNKSQNARQRALEDFRSGHVRILVATDIAARGIDIDNVSHVINFEVPNVAESYVHRIGRTARAGAEGIAISFCDSEEKSFIRDIERLIGKKIPVNMDHPFHSVAVEKSSLISSGKAKAMVEGRGGQGRNYARRGPPRRSGNRDSKAPGRASSRAPSRAR